MSDITGSDWWKILIMFPGCLFPSGDSIGQSAMIVSSSNQQNRITEPSSYEGIWKYKDGNTEHSASTKQRDGRLSTAGIIKMALGLEDLRPLKFITDIQYFNSADYPEHDQLHAEVYVSLSN